MAKLSNTTTALKPTTKKKGGTSPIQTKDHKRTTTADGMDTAALKSKSELFLTAVSTYAGEDTYYESGNARLLRIRELVQKVTKKDPEWIERFVPWLRGEANIRTLSIIIAAEYVAAGGPNGRELIAKTLQRADEPAEFIAYWCQNFYGWDGQSYPLPSPKLPQAVRKGVSDACAKLYNEYTLIKYDGNSRGVGMSEVLNLVHPTVRNYPKHWTEDRVQQQMAIFKYIIDKEYGNAPDTELLPLLTANLEVRKLDRDGVLALTSDQLKDAGVTWEQMGGLLNGPWTAKAWEALIPNMGYMALLRNLRNFEAAGISKTYVKKVNEILEDPERVRKSRQMPYRFYSAYKNVQSEKFMAALAEALDYSCENIPEFDGRTLVLVDKSGSMDGTLSRGSNFGTGYSPHYWEVGALFGVAMWKKAEDCDLAIFGDYSKVIKIPKGTSVLNGIKLLTPNNGVGHGTNIWGSVKDQFNGHDRVVIFTDMQSNINHYAYRGTGDIPFIHAYNLAGYGGSGMPQGSGDNGRYQYGGFSDKSFMLMNLLEHMSTGWPF